VVLTLAKKNLNKMISTSTVALASICDKEKLKARVGDLECVTYRFFISPKEVNQLKYSMRKNDTLFFKDSIYLLQVICFENIICFLNDVYLFFVINRCLTERQLGHCISGNYEVIRTGEGHFLSTLCT
jgi:hypothetical protein